MAYFAWSKILIGADVDPKTGIAAKHEYVQVGEEVDAAKLNVSDEQFDEYITSGAIREYEYPDVPEGYQDSPLNFFRDRIRRVESELTQVGGGSGGFGIAQRSLTEVHPLGNTKKETNTEPGQQPAGEQTPGTAVQL
jgi:hypothetical protein